MAGHDGSNVRLIDNPNTWLAFIDLVLIDPVGTGWSRAAKPDGASAFWGSAWISYSTATSALSGIGLAMALVLRCEQSKHIPAAETSIDLDQMRKIAVCQPVQA
jgi:hypothetical protein